MTSHKNTVATVVKQYENVGTCLVCGCDLPDGKCATVTLLEPYDSEAAQKLREEGYTLDSEVGAYFSLANLPLIKAAKERQKAQDEAHKAKAPAVQSYSENNKKSGSSAGRYTFEQPAHQLFLYILRFLFPLVDMSQLNKEEFNQIIRSYDMDMTPSGVRKRHFMHGVEEDSSLYFAVMIEPTKKDEGYSQSVWSFTIIEHKLRIRNVFSDKANFLVTEWSFNIF